MFRTVALRCVKKPSSTLGFAKHMPKDYVERIKRTVPKKVYSNRLGAPDIIRWEMPPEDYIPTPKYPWSGEVFKESIDRTRKYHESLLRSKFFRLRKPLYNKRLSDDNWFIFKGDWVMVMVGKDKNCVGKVIQVYRDTNTVLVEGLHTKLNQEMDEVEKYGIQKITTLREEPLDVSKNEVMLINPYDDSPTFAEWKLNDEGTEYIRVSTSTGHVIPLPAEAFTTYEYNEKENYLENDKDTKADVVLKITYIPKLCAFEDEIMESLGIRDERQRKPTFWY
uniref:Large ribosomal subunit protein uL24m n=1 Tax=Strongyloides venezuelensis TaxID=75913 RepID=A0A0K0FXL9_STRVS